MTYAGAEPFHLLLRRRQPMIQHVMARASVWFSLFAPSFDAPARELHREPTYRSPAVLAADAGRGRLYVAEATAARISIVDLANGSMRGTITLADDPTGLTLSPDGSVLFVTLGVARGQLLAIDVEDEPNVRRLIDLGHSPVAPVVSDDGRTLWFCRRFADQVASVNLESGTVETVIEVPREPIACASTPDGGTLVVTTHLPSGPANGTYTAIEVVLIDTKSRAVRRRVPLPNGSTAARDVCVTPDGRHALVPHILARYHHPTTQLERGWINTNALSIVDVVEGRLLTTVLLDEPERGAANPWGVAVRGDGRQLVVTHAGSHVISLVDWSRLEAKITALSPDERERVPDDLAFLQGLRRRVPLAGRGPRDVTFLSDRILVAEYYSDTVGVVECEGDRWAARSLPLGPTLPITEKRRGEMLFHDATICFQEWQSCSSCHPDARSDGLNWDLLNDGFGNPKNTKSLLAVHGTAPAMITGIRPDAASAVRAGIRHILFAVRPEDEAHALLVYLSALKPVPSPWLEDGQLSPAARRGAARFEEAGCARCHPAPLYTDRRTHDLTNTRGRDAGRALDTPTLLEVWRTAPYLHDGRAVDLRAMFLKHDAAGRHGQISALTPRELEDLLAFLRSL